MKIGDKVVIYHDPYWNLGYEGEAELVEYIGEGLPFILEETQDKYQITYKHKIWKVRFGNFTCIRKIRYRVSNSGVVLNEDGYNYTHIKDKFIEVHGREIY